MDIEEHRHIPHNPVALFPLSAGPMKALAGVRTKPDAFRDFVNFSSDRDRYFHTRLSDRIPQVPYTSPEMRFCSDHPEY